MTDKGNSKNKNKEKDNKVNFQSNDKFKTYITDFFKSDPTLNPQTKLKIINNEEENKNVRKQNRENEILLMIEKTFGGRISFLIFYIIFLIVILNKLINSYSISNKNLFFTAIKNEFIKNTFLVDIKIQDFLEGSTNDSLYRVSLNLDEVNDVRLLPTWLTEVYFNKLGFYDKSFLFLEKHKLIGKMRFLQVRSEDKGVQCINQNTQVGFNSSLYDQNCYGEEFTHNKSPKKYNCEDIKNIISSTKDPNEKLYITDKTQCDNPTDYIKGEFLDPCDKTNKNNYNNYICQMYTKGSEYRTLSKVVNGTNITEDFIYKGEFNVYNQNSAFFFDIDYNTTDFDLNKINLLNFGNYLFRNWIDYHSRLLMISFNCYQTSDDDPPKIFSVTLMIEFSKTQTMFKYFDISFYGLDLDFLNINFQKIFSQFGYFLLLFFYSSIHLYFNLSELYKERLNIIYKQFTLFIVNFSINCLVLVALIFRIIISVQKISNMTPYQNIGFTEYFPIMYYTANLESLAKYVEIIMIGMIILNILNSFYFEFFARIFLTFSFAWKYIFAYLTIYLIIIIAYAASCNILFGSYIQSKFFLKIFLNKFFILNFFHLIFFL